MYVSVAAPVRLLFCHFVPNLDGLIDTDLSPSGRFFDAGSWLHVYISCSLVA